MFFIYCYIFKLKAMNKRKQKRLIKKVIKLDEKDELYETKLTHEQLQLRKQYNQTT